MLRVTRTAARMTIAALLALLGTKAAGLKEGYWAVITCLVVVEATAGATIRVGAVRLAGTAGS
jgi:uncharacterized membrane protein YccC